MMYQLKKEDVLKKALMEIAKQVSFPDWNVMHGLEGRPITSLDYFDDFKIPKDKKSRKIQKKAMIRNTNEEIITLSSHTPNINITHTNDAITHNLKSEDIKKQYSKNITTNQNKTELIEEVACEGQANAHNSTEELKDEAMKKQINDEHIIEEMDVQSKLDAEVGDILSASESNNVDHSNDVFKAIGHMEDSIKNCLISEKSSIPLVAPPLCRTRSDSDVLRQVSAQIKKDESPTNVHLLEPFANRPFRKKSMSFAGTLPIRIEITPDKFDSDEANTVTSTLLPTSPREMGSKRNDRYSSVSDSMIQTRRSPKSPRRSRKGSDKKANDPSHYLGRRRGSYNPVYEQTQLPPPPKHRGRDQRAKSLFVGRTGTDEEFRKSLISRLMLHASPALRESFSEDIEGLEEDENQSKDSNGTEMKEIELETENASITIVSENKDDHQSIPKRQKTSLSKSLSLDRIPSHRVSMTEEKSNLKESEKSSKVVMKRRPWETSCDSILYSKVENGNQQANDCRKHSKSGSDNGSTNGSIGIRHGHQENSDFKKASNGKWVHPRTDDSVLMKRYHRQSRSKSCYESLHTPMFTQMEFEHSLKSKGCADSSSSSSSDEGEGEKSNRSIHAAAKAGRLKRLKKLIEGGLDVNTLDDYSWPPIHYALLGGHFNCVAYLLTKGADIRHYSKGRTLKYFK